MRDTALDRAMGTDWGFWSALAEAELFLLLEEEAAGAELRPRVFEVSDGPMVLVFDAEDRMAAFSPVPVPYAALPGRVVADLAARQGLAMGLNLGTGAASETMLPAEALAWLGEALAEGQVAEEARVAEAVAAPDLDGAGLAAVEAVMRAGLGLAGEALVARARWQGDGQGILLAFPGVAEADQPALARAVAEALALSGLDAAALDVGFPAEGSALLTSLRRVARRYVAEAPAEVPEEAPKGPGMDPGRPPVLR